MLFFSLFYLYFISCLCSKVKLKSESWRTLSVIHHFEVLNSIYPDYGDINLNFKKRQHLTDSDPIYNFLHTYYNFPVSKLAAYSPGLDVILEDASEKDVLKNFKIDKYYSSNLPVALSSSFLNPTGVHYDSNGCYYHPEFIKKESKSDKSGSVIIDKFSNLKLEYVRNILNIMLKSSMRSPNFNCFGLHEWAMQYSGRVNQNSSGLLPKHQKLPLRVSQAEIDDLVEGKLSGCGLKCTHFDAFRFFQEDAKGLNLNKDLSRSSQEDHEQPGCIHATMDLFKYAYTLYPYVGSELLRETLNLAISARKIDMRSSPYDISQYLPDESPISVENIEGRKEFALEQEKLFKRSLPLRIELISVYNRFLNLADNT